MDRVQRMVSERPVVIFSKSSCIMSHTVKSLFNDFGVNPTVYELDEIARGPEIEQALSGLGYSTVPAVFIGAPSSLLKLNDIKDCVHGAEENDRAHHGKTLPTPGGGHGNVPAAACPREHGHDLNSV
ncbi:monothiol glutaredoxin-S4-like protein [Tanacetum coccineum]